MGQGPSVMENVCDDYSIDDRPQSGKGDDEAGPRGPSSLSLSSSLASSTDFYGRSSLHFAGWHGDLATLQQLLETGADVDGVLLLACHLLPPAPTCLHLVLLTCSWLTFPWHVGRDRNGCTACHYAIFQGHTECVEALLRAGATVEWKVRCSWPAHDVRIVRQ